LRAVRAILVRCARLIWGERRGPRAARRMIFELSWRFAGARTYAAAGWPGRMFYKES
jgi:spore maturation protein CgeB